MYVDKDNNVKKRVNFIMNVCYFDLVEAVIRTKNFHKKMN